MIRKKLLAGVLAGVMFFTIVGCEKAVKITTGFKENVIFKLSETEIPYNEVLLVLLNEKNRYESDFGVGIWGKDMGDVSIEESVKMAVKEKLVYLEAMSAFAKERKTEISEEEKQILENAATEYFSTLTEDEIKKIGVSVEDVLHIYEKNFFATKVYENIVKDVSVEVSDEEARVMGAFYIYISKGDNKEEAKAKITQAYSEVTAGADFNNIAKKYTEDLVVNLDIARGDMVETVESAAFELVADECSDIIEAEKGYYIIKCINPYIESKTEANKVNIVKKARNQAFLDKFEPYLKGLKLDVDDGKWDDILFADFADVKTGSLMEVYEKYVNQIL